MRNVKSPKNFYDREAWQRLRYSVLRKHGYKCLACGATREEGAQIHVDHIQPISIYPELALTESNLQVLCRPCNMGKSNLYADDLRRPHIVPQTVKEEKIRAQKEIKDIVERLLKEKQPEESDRLMKRLRELRS